LTSDAYLAMPRSARATVLATIIDVVFVRRGPGGPRGPRALPIDDSRVRILWRDQAPDDLPARGRFDSSGIRPWDGFAEREPQPRMTD
jgi:hypothetical protein